MSAHEKDGALLVDIVVQPRASKPGVGPMVGDRVKVRVGAPPVDGAANQAVIETLAAALGVRKSAVEIVAGGKGRRKTVRIAGATRVALEAALAAAMLALLLVLPACGETLQPSYDISIIAPEGVDPFAGATRVVLDAAGMKREAAVVPGQPFDLAILGLAPSKTAAGPIKLDAFDAAGTVVAHGETPSLAFQTTTGALIRILVQAPATLGLLGQIRPRRDLVAGAAQEKATGLGAVMFGTGIAEVATMDGGKSLEADTQIGIWNPISHTIDATAGSALPPVRSASLVALGDNTLLLFGGEAPATAPATGFVTKGNAAIYQLVRATFDSFSKQTDKALLSISAEVARASAAMAVADTPLAFGGRNDAGPLDTIVRIKPTETGAAAFALLEQKLAVPRVGHSATTVTGPSTTEILIWGGAPDDRPEAPVAEVFQAVASPPSFIALDAAATGPHRRDHATVTLAGGKVLVVGGLGADGKPLASAVVYDAKTRTTTLRDKMLATARAGACVLVVDGDLLIAGGADGAGNPVADAEIFDAATLAPVATIPAQPRSHAACALLPNHAALLIGGIADSDGNATGAIEIYQPRR